jgi:predicted phage-related endonuclease
MAITAEQKERRKGYIGSSDVPRIMMGRGFRVAADKLGLTDDVPDEEDREALAVDDGDDDVFQRPGDDDLVEEDSFEIQIGHKVEAAVLDAYEKRMRPDELERSPDTIVSERYPWLAVHLDGRATYPARRVNTEAKTVGYYRRKEWGESADDIPLRVQWQVQTQMLVTGLEETHIPVCFIDAVSLKYLFLEKLPPIRIYEVRADAVLQEYIVEKTRTVFEHVQAGMLPPPDTVEDVMFLYRRDDGRTVIADDATFANCVILADVKAKQKELKARRDELELNVKLAMDTAAELRFDNLLLATWKKALDGEKLDKKALERDHPDLYRRYLVPTLGSRRFLLKDKNIKGE